MNSVSTKFSLVMLAMGVAAHALTPPPPASVQLTDNGLPNDAHSAYVFLRDGLPKDFRPKYGKETWPFESLRIFQLLITASAETEDRECVPTLLQIMKDEYPRQLDESIDLEALRTFYSNVDASWEEWDKARARQMCYVRNSAIAVLGKFKDESILPDVRTVLARQENLPNFNLHASSLLSLCGIASALGDPAGVDAVLSVSPRVPQEDTWAIENLLEQVTGHWFRANADHNDPMSAEQIADWKDWWAKNRDGFDFEAARERVRAKNLAAVPRDPNTMSIKERVMMATDMRNRTSDSPVNSWTAWVDENADKNLKAIRAIAEDQNEDNHIRDRAASAYLYYAPRREAYRWVARMVVKPKSSGDRAPYSVPSEPFERMNAKKPGTIDRVARECVRRNSQGAEAAIRKLAVNPENAAFIAEQFGALTDPTARLAAINALIGLKYKEVAPFAAALSDSNLEVRFSGLSALVFLNLTGRLNESDKAVFQTLMKDPQLLCRLGESGSQQPLGGKTRLDWLREARLHAGNNKAQVTLVDLHIFFATVFGKQSQDACDAALKSVIAGVSAWREARGRAPIEALL